MYIKTVNRWLLSFALPRKPHVEGESGFASLPIILSARLLWSALSGKLHVEVQSQCLLLPILYHVSKGSVDAPARTSFTNALVFKRLVNAHSVTKRAHLPQSTTRMMFSRCGVVDGTKAPELDYSMFLLNQ
jgi:hypothetical protein